jgi:pimeloyl-ACP methyl ester carboxylesterase
LLSSSTTGGRGESTDTLPCAVEREIEDIEALIGANGGLAHLYGLSSGAALAMRAAARLGSKVTKLALYEPPYGVGDSAADEFAAYVSQMNELLETGRRSEAVALFLGDMMPPEALDAMKQSSRWPLLEAVAPTLAYDNAVMGDGTLPIGEIASVLVPTLVLDGSESPSFLRESAEALAKALPRSVSKTLECETHRPEPAALAAVLREYLLPH